MKRCIAFLILIVTGCFAHGQNIDSFTLSKLRLNFAVPDMPAFKSLGTEPSNLLRPSTVQALAISTSEFYQDRKIVLPQAFAVEVSPALLINASKPAVQLKQYARRAVINSLRFSLGTSDDPVLSPSGRSLALGARISLINEGDLTTDTGYQDSISNALKNFRLNVRNNSLKTFAVANGIDISQLDWEDTIMSDKKLKAAFDTYLSNEEEQSQQGFLQELNRLKAAYRQRYWNATKLDLAASLLSSSPDSLVKNIRFNNAQFWLTYAQKAGPNGQFLLGLNLQVYKNLADTTTATQDKSWFSLSVPARYLLGTNRVKGFAEAQYSYLGEFKEHSFLFNLGSEFNIVDGVWVNLFGGLDYNTTAGTTTFRTNFNLKLTLPENFKFF